MGDLRDAGLIPRLGTSLGEGNGNPLQSSCLGNPMNRGTWRDTVHEITKSQTRLSDETTSMAERTGTPGPVQGTDRSPASHLPSVLGI